MRPRRPAPVLFSSALVLAAALAIAAVSPPLETPSPVAYFPYFNTYPGTTSLFQVMNLGTSSAQVSVTYYAPDGSVASEKMFTVGPGKLADRNASQDAGSEFKGSAVVQSDVPVVVEQTHLQSGYSGSYGNTSIGSKMPGTNWGLLNGHNVPYSSGSYKSTAIYVQNPGTAAASVTITHYFPSMAPVQTTIPVPAGNLKYLYGSDSPGYNQFYGSVVVSDNPVVCAVVQSGMMNSDTSFSRVAPMPMNPAQSWYTFGGALFSGFTTKFQILNANDSAANVTFNFVGPQGDLSQTTRQVPANSYQQYSQSDLGLGGATGAARISSDQPLYLAQVVNWANSGQEAVLPPVKNGSTKWGFAGCESSDTARTYFQVQNIGSTATTVNVKFYPQSGTPVTTSFVMPGNSNKSFAAAPYLSQGRFGAQFQSTSGIVVGRTILRNNGRDGDSSPGFNLYEPRLVVTPAAVEYVARAGGSWLQSRGRISVGFYIPGLQTAPAFPWTATSDAPWLSCTESGSGSSSFDPMVNISGMTRGTYTGTITIAAPGVQNSPQTVTVKLTIF